AYAIGIGPSQTVFLWDTLLDGRFTPREVRFVTGHELAHLARRHIWKGLAWGVLFGVPILAAVAVATGRRGGLRNPETVPVALLGKESCIAAGSSWKNWDDMFTRDTTTPGTSPSSIAWSIRANVSVNS